MSTCIRLWQIKRSLKNLNVEIENEDGMIRSLQNRDLLKMAGKLVDNPRVLLCCYMIVHYPNNILAQDVFDYYLRHKAQKLLEVLEALKKKYSLGCFVLFQLRFIKFSEYFESWKQKDLIKLCVPIVHEYWELDALKEKYEGIAHEHSIIAEQQQLVVERLKRIHRDVDGLLEKYKDNAPSLEETIAESFYKRWVRDLHDELSREEYGRVPALVGDIRDMVMALVPNNEDYKKRVKDALDVELLENMVANVEIDSEYVYKLITFVMRTIRELESADMDKDTDTVVSLLEDMFRQKFSYAQILTFFFQVTFQKLELIAKRKSEVMSELNNSTN